MVWQSKLKCQWFDLLQFKFGGSGILEKKSQHCCAYFMFLVWLFTVQFRWFWKIWKKSHHCYLQFMSMVWLSTVECLWFDLPLFHFWWYWKIKSSLLMVWLSTVPQNKWFDVLGNTKIVKCILEICDIYMGCYFKMFHCFTNEDNKGLYEI